MDANLPDNETTAKPTEPRHDHDTKTMPTERRNNDNASKRRCDMMTEATTRTKGRPAYDYAHPIEPVTS